MEQFENVDQYIADLKEKLKANATCGNTLYNLGVAYLSKREFMDAERVFLDAVANSPRMAEAYVQLGGIALQRGDMEGCLNYNVQATQQRPFFAVPWGNIGFVQMQMGQPDEAHKSLKRALKYDPGFLQAMATMSSVYIALEDFEEASLMLKKILDKEPHFGPAWNNMAVVNAHNEQWEEAAKCVDLAKENGFDVLPELEERIKANI